MNPPPASSIDPLTGGKAPERGSPLQRYGLALGSILIATLVRWPLSPVLGNEAPFLLFTLAVLISAWYGGLKPGLLATALGALIGSFFWREPQYSLAITSAPELLEVTLFAATGVLVSVLGAVRGRVEHQLSLANRRHVETLESLTDGFIAFDRDLRYVFVNPRGEALVRRPRAELLGRRIDEVFPDLLESEFYRQARKALEDGASAVVEEYYAPLDTWFESHLYPSPHGLSCVVRDVTAERRSQREREELLAREQAARRELEAALAAQQEGEAQLRFALEAGRMGAWEWDIRSGAIRWSDNLEPLHGLAPGSFAGTFEAFQELIHPEDRERVQDALAVALDESGGYDIEFRVVWPDESIRWMAGRGMVIRDAEGRPARMVGLGVDITARKEAQAAVVRTNERYRLATAAVDGVVYDFDIDSGRVERSEGLVRVVGYHPHEAGTTSAWWSDRIHPEDRPRAAAAMQAARERGAQYSHEYRVRHRDNTYRHVWDQGLVLRDGAGRAIRLVGCCVDITERVRAEEGLRFLAESSELLAASLDYETTLASVARLAVPHIADWCAVDLVGEDGRPHRLAVTHVDPEKVQWAHELEQRYPPDPNAPTGVPNVIRTGRAELYSEIPDELLVLAARDEEHLRIIRELGMTSAMIVPLFARGRALGAISFITAESGRRYGAADLRLAEDLARRAAVGIDNARLFAEAREARRVAEAAREALEAERAAAVAQAEELQLVNEELECQREELATQTEELQANQGELRLQQARLEFLLQVSEELGASLESDERVLQRLADLAVPVLCDWCVIDGLGDDGRLRRLGQAASDAATVELLREIETRYPPSPEWQAHPLSVLSSGHPQLVPAIPASELASFARDAEHLRLIRALDARSRLLVPLHAGGRPLGVLTLVMGRSGRTYSEVELSLAMELAVRVSMALDNARLYGELRQADRAKEDFLAMLAHELRNPLAPLRNAVEVLRLTADREAQERNREVIARQAEHMTRLVDDLLDMSRITRGKIELRKEAVPLCTLVERAVEACAAAIEAAGHQFEVSAPTVPVWLDADPTRLEQVLINLLGNAAKYTEPGGEVHLSVEAESRDGRPWAVVRVVDSGVGIAPELLPDIFDLFMQADRSLDRAQGGLGIGLTLVRNLVELHGGTVEAHSAGPGHGSEFVVSLPALAAAPEGAKASASAQTALPVLPTVSAPRVLVVDDNVDAAETLADLLDLWGHPVRTVHDGGAALEQAESFQPAVVLLDIGLPGIDGYEVAERLRRDQGYCGLLIALTGYGQDEDRRRSEEAGFDHHLTKPVDPEVLRALLTSPPRVP